MSQEKNDIGVVYETMCSDKLTKPYKYLSSYVGSLIMTNMAQDLMSVSTTAISNPHTISTKSESSALKAYTIALEKGQDGWIVVKCPDLPGVVTQGKTEEEAINNAIEAIGLMLEDLGLDKEFNIMVIRRV